MRLVTFRASPDSERIGALVNGDRQIVDLAKAHQAQGAPAVSWLADMLSLADAGDRGLDHARVLVDETLTRGRDAAIVDATSVELLAPVPVPRQIRDFLCFEEHYQRAREMRFRRLAAQEPDPEAAFQGYVEKGAVGIAKVWYEQPVYYKANRFSVVGPEAEVRWPHYARLLDYELEFGIFLGKKGVNIRREDAREHILGYTIFNDVSARDAQSREMESQLGPSKGKDFDTGNVLGPCLVTADEIPDPYSLTMVARVNGEEWSRGSSASMHWRFEDLISWASQDETLHPGEFFGSGTVGTGCGLELDRWLQPGDVVELEVEKIGVLRNRIVGRG